MVSFLGGKAFSFLPRSVFMECFEDYLFELSLPVQLLETCMNKTIIFRNAVNISGPSFLNSL